MKLRELVLVRGILPVVGGTLSTAQFAYQRQRSTETLLSDLHQFVYGERNGDAHMYVAGLNIAGASDSASYSELIDALERLEVPKILVRFIGEWIPARSFTVRLNPAIGTVLSSDFHPTKGVPHGGVPSPLLWIIHTN